MSTDTQNTDPFGTVLRDPEFLAKTKADAALRNMTVEERRQHRIKEFEAQQAAQASAAAKPKPRKTDEELAALFAKASPDTIARYESALDLARQATEDTVDEYDEYGNPVYPWMYDESEDAA